MEESCCKKYHQDFWRSLSAIFLREYSLQYHQGFLGRVSTYIIWTFEGVPHRKFCLLFRNQVTNGHNFSWNYQKDWSRSNIFWTAFFSLLHVGNHAFCLFPSFFVSWTNSIFKKRPCPSHCGLWGFRDPRVAPFFLLVLCQKFFFQSFQGIPVSFCSTSSSSSSGCSSLLQHLKSDIKSICCK